MSYSVYVANNEKGYVVNIASSYTLTDLTGWTKIDEGDGDKYQYPLENYLAKGLYDSDSLCNYKLVNSVLTECTEADKEAQRAFNPVPPRLDSMVKVLQKPYDLFTSLDGGAYVVGKPGILHVPECAYCALLCVSGSVGMYAAVMTGTTYNNEPQTYYGNGNIFLLDRPDSGCIYVDAGTDARLALIVGSDLETIRWQASLLCNDD